MKSPGKAATIYLVGFVLFLLLFSYFLLTYTRRVDGVSMRPTLEEGDLVVISGADPGNVVVGDIIVYDPPCSSTGFSVIHRVVGVQGTGFITRGDNNPSTDQAAGIADGPITGDCIVGKVVYVVPYVERLASLPYGTNYILAVLIFVGVIYFELRDRNGDEGKEEEMKPPGSEEMAAILG
ncbi:MAG: signal peptidase I [Thaumarchaeota archaeon]|nr:signal peptidase I [Nitrososphaerota archaeon]